MQTRAQHDRHDLGGSARNLTVLIPFMMETEEVREHFRVQASDYQELMKRLIPYFEQQREIMLQLIPFELSRGLRVLAVRGESPASHRDR